MADRNVIVRDDSNSVASAGLILVAVLVIAALAAMFVWQPWNAGASRSSSTTIQQTNPSSH